MNSRSRLFTFFNLEPGEGLLVLMMLAHSFFIGSACIFARTSAYALFLAEFDASYLPYVYIGIGTLVTLLSFIYLKLSQRIPFAWLLSASVGFLLVSLLGFRLGLGLSSSKWLIFLLPIWYEVLWTLTNLEFWNLAGRVFNLRQGKRLFGIIGTGEQTATILGGLLMPLVVGFTGTPNLLLVAAASMAGVLGLLVYTAANFSERLAEPVQSTATKTQKSTLSLLKNRYILAIFGLFTLDIIVYFTVDNIFYSQAQAAIPSEQRLASFIGAFFGVCGVLSLLSRTFLSSKVLNRYGVRGSLLITPLLMLGGSLAAALTGIFPGAVAAFFWLVALVRLIDMVFLVSVEMPAKNILYQPLPAEQRMQTQTMAEGIVYSLSIGLTGVVLSILSRLVGLSDRQLIFVVVVLLTVWITLALRMGRMYPQALVNALARRRLDSSGVVWDEGAAIPILERELHSPHAGTALYALNMLEAARPASLAAALPSLLDHPEALVRQEALQRMERLSLTSAAGAIRTHLEVETAPAVRGAAVCALGALGGIEAFETLSAVMDDPLPQVRRGAMVGLLRNGGIQGVLQAGSRLLEMACSPEAEQRILAAQVLGEVANRSFYQPLLPMLYDESPPVRRAALLAAGQIQNPRLWPAVVHGLNTAAVRPAAASALVSGGPAVLPEINLAFAQEAGDRRPLVSVTGRIGGPQAVEWLKSHLDDRDAAVRTSVLRALSRCGYRAGGADSERLRLHIIQEIQHAASLLAQVADLEAEAGADLLCQALRYSLDHVRERIFYLLSFIYEAGSVLGARDNLALASAERKSYALEVLDVSLDGEIKKLFFPLLSAQPAAQTVQQLDAFFPQPRRTPGARLQEIITAGGQASSWVQACALYTAGCLALAALSPQMEAALAAPDPLVREAAGWSLSRLDKRSGSARSKPQSSHSPTSGRSAVLTTVEKVIALKKVSLFDTIPDETLVDVAALLEEVTLEPDETIFEKGDLGDCMYLIVDGGVRVHDGASTLNQLGAGEVFGEMSVLDAEPRSASVTAQQETLLLRLAQEPLFALTDEQPEVARRILRVLSRRLRARVQDLNELRRQLAHRL